MTNFSKTYLSGILLSLFLLFSSDIAAQIDTTAVTINLQVTRNGKMGYAPIIIINTRLGLGFTANADGSYIALANKSDILSVFSEGYGTANVSVKDSVYKPIYNISIDLKPITVLFERAVVIRPKPTFQELEQAQKRIDSYKYDPIIKEQGLSKLSSPISFLYQQFSKKEKDKREYVALLNEEAYKDAMKALIAYFDKSGLIAVNENEAEQFIDYCGISKDFIKKASLYQVGEAFNNCYAEFAKRSGY